jgi:hypothetical protein
MQVSRQALYRLPAPRAALKRRAVSDPIAAAIVEEATANQTDGYRMVTAFVRRTAWQLVLRCRADEASPSSSTPSLCTASSPASSRAARTTARPSPPAASERGSPSSGSTTAAAATATPKAGLHRELVRETQRTGGMAERIRDARRRQTRDRRLRRPLPPPAAQRLDYRTPYEVKETWEDLQNIAASTVNSGGEQVNPSDLDEGCLGLAEQGIRHNVEATFAVQLKGESMKRMRGAFVALVIGVSFLLFSAVAGAQGVGGNVRVTIDNGANGRYLSADQLAGGSYTDGVLQRCGLDRRMQNEPTLAIDPRNASVWTSGSNDYCTVPTAGDAWAGFYRTGDGGSTWADSLLPAYSGDSSSEGLSSPLHQMVAGGATAAGDPVQAFDGQGDLFYMGNNFNRGSADGNSFRTRDNTGDVWVATYAPSNPADSSTDGSKYVRTVLLASNTFGQGSFNDKTAMAVDPVTGYVYASWSDFHGSGCNQILLSRSTDHGVTFSQPVKLSSGICGNQGPSIAIGPGGHVSVGWQGTTGGSSAKAPGALNGAAFVHSTDYGQTFSPARLVLTYTPFSSVAFSGNGARECGDAPFNCPTGFTFPRFDLAGPYLAADNVNGTLVMAFQAAQPSGQGQIEYAYSTDGGANWSTPALLAASTDGHQFFPYLSASAGRVSAVFYDSRGDSTYSPTRPPCNSASGQTSACLNVRYAESTDGGKTWGQSLQVTDQPTNPNYEQFGGRRAPFFGDYITVAAQGNTVGAVWTDQRDTVGAADTSATADNDGADVAGDPETGGTCTSSLTPCFDGTGGLDQNIYSAAITP